jgi:hypothetical protein
MEADLPGVPEGAAERVAGVGLSVVVHREVATADAERELAEDPRRVGGPAAGATKRPTGFPGLGRGRLLFDLLPISAWRGSARRFRGPITVWRCATEVLAGDVADLFAGCDSAEGPDALV